MSETAPAVDFEERLQGVLARTPWMEEKFTAIEELLVTIGNGEWQGDNPANRSRLAYVGDSEFQDWRIAIRFDTDERLTRVSDRYTVSGQRDFNLHALSMGHLRREINGYPRYDILWTRSEGGLLVTEVARTIARGLGTLSLALSEKYERELAQPR